MKTRTIDIIIFLLFSANVVSQNVCDTLPFLNCIKNHITIKDTNQTKILSKKFNSLKNLGNNPISIVHIGDSHLQAGFLSEKIKQELFQIYSNNDSTVSPGFIFPFTMAKTNNPYFYKVSYSGNWSWCKNVENDISCNLGISGITLQTNDSIAYFSIKMKNEKYNLNKEYFFNTLKLFHNSDTAILVKVNNKEITLKNTITKIKFNQLTDSVHFEIQVKDSTKFFELYGLTLENDLSAINYHTIGINGAEAQSYLKCNYFSSQLNYINPDLIIISLGTNEAFDDNYSALEHQYILSDLILQIQNAVPHAFILLSTPNDQYKNKEPNKNVILVRENILKICQEYKLNFWDFYSVMGGEESIKEWHNTGLAGEDKLHFRRTGYEIQGKLFVNALNQMIEMNP